MLVRLLKLLKWDISDRFSRFQMFNAVLMHLPGRVGFELRRLIIPKYFASCGLEVHILNNVRYRGINNLVVGNNVRIGDDVFIQASGGVTLEDDVMLGPGVKIWSINHRYDSLERPIWAQGYICDPVVIGKGCWLGANAIVLPGVNLPEGCVVSAGSVVNKKQYPPFSIIAGNPARVIGTRVRN